MLEAESRQVRRAWERRMAKRASRPGINVSRYRSEVGMNNRRARLRALALVRTRTPDQLVEMAVWRLRISYRMTIEAARGLIEGAKLKPAQLAMLAGGQA